MWLSRWRFGLRLAVGLAHIALWDGDILALDAIGAPVVSLVRRLPVPLLGAAGVVRALAGPLSASFIRAAAGGSAAELRHIWLAGAGRRPAR